MSLNSKWATAGHRNKWSYPAPRTPFHDSSTIPQLAAALCHLCLIRVMTDPVSATGPRLGRRLWLQGALCVRITLSD